MEARFGHEFGGVRVHADDRAAASAEMVGARAYTVGKHIAFSRDYTPGTTQGTRLLAHELAHVVQQRGQGAQSSQLTPAAVAVQRDNGGPRVQVRSPVFEETVTQASDIAGGLGGRGLTIGEQALALPIFGSSLDYSQVRLLTLDLLQYRTVGNNIYIPEDFTIDDQDAAQTLIHELTHVWQYQHGGTSYISLALGAQIVAAITTPSRNFAYDYSISSSQSFFDFNPEQQGHIVENYFAMLRDQAAIPGHQAAGLTQTYASNHMDSDGFPVRLESTQRLAEIATELPEHERVVGQMQAAMPRSETETVQLRAMDVMQLPGQGLFPVREELQIMPIRPILEIRF